ALDDGRELWDYSYPVKIKRNHGMSRTVPMVTDRFLVGIGPKCHLFCLDPITGKEYWPVKDMVAEYGVTVPAWYAGQCPLIDSQGRLIIGTGSEDSLLIAIDPETGKLLWKTPNPKAWKMTHVSVIPMHFAGQDMFIYCGKGGVAGISADDGRLLWETTDWKINIATVPSPVPLPNGRIFCSGGYNSGAVMLQLQAEPDGKIAVETLYRLKPKQFGSAQHTPIFYQGHLFGVRERDEQLVCLDLEGNEVWKSGSENKFGIGPYMIADGLIWVLEDSGKLTIVEATPEAYRPVASAQVLDGHDAWAPMALADGLLLLRDLTQLVCLDVRNKENKQEE
ncbi:MAG: PQQ-binding-like beta-propeller repeat protein, partial [Planctomycetia bacterium]